MAIKSTPYDYGDEDTNALIRSLPGNFMAFDVSIEPDTEPDSRGQLLLDHAAEIDAAVKFGQFLMEQDQREMTTSRLRELAVECFCGRDRD